MNAALLGALINQIAIPEIVRWLASLHEQGRIVTEADILAKLNTDIDEADAAGRAFLESTKPPQPALPFEP